MDITATPPAKLLAGAKRHIQGIRSDIGDLRFRGDEFRAHIGEGVLLDALLTRTIEGASTVRLVIHDPEGEVRRSKLVLEKFDVELDGLWFRFAGMGRTDRDTITLTFQARNVDRLRLVPPTPISVKRDDMTRAEFWVSQARTWIKGSPIPIWCPELHEVQPIKKTAEMRKVGKQVDITREKGIGADAGGIDGSADLEVKGVPASNEQLANGETVLQVGASLNAPVAAMLASIMVGTQENNMENTGSYGYFAIMDPGAAGLDVSDLAECAHSFFADGFGTGTGAIDYANQGMSPNDIAAAVERPAPEFRHLYGQWESQAREWLAAFSGGEAGTDGSITKTTTTTRIKDYRFERRANESLWANGVRLFEEVNWRFFEAAEIIYVVTEPELLSSKVRMHVNDADDAIESITYDYLVGKKQDQVSVSCRARSWAAPPGSVAAVHGQGPVDGRYIVAEIESNLLKPDELCTITLKRPQKPLPEPAPETVTKTKTKTFGTNTGGTETGGASSTESGVGTFDGKPVAKWIIPWLEKSREAGWGGTVTSGYRTPEESESICIGMCGQPSCPGTCAGASSNHSGNAYPEGAVDVSDYTTFASVQRQIGSPLKNDLPADPVHFSVSGH